ncbi:MAG: prepilin-type N-terminal cleavage/methylation domain-containing protein, partial [Proteobacteria bacterium]
MDLSTLWITEDYMRTQSKENRSAVKSNAGFTLVEVMVSGGVM